MWTLLALLLFPGCSSPEPPPGGAPATREPRRSKGPGKVRKSKSKTPPGPPLGVAGPVVGELTLTVVAAAPAPVEGTPEAPAPAPAPTPQDPASKRTQADLTLTFSDGQSKPVPLGKVDGVCTDTPVAPIGPEGSQQTPLWSVQCVAGATTQLAILQTGDQITVLRASPSPDGTVAYKPVKRVRLAPGATLTRKSG